MIIDIILASIVFVWGVLGYRQGFIRRGFALAGIILVALFSAPVANILHAIITVEFNIPLNEYYAKTALLAAAACIIYVACFLIGKFLHNTLVKGIKIAEKTNHIFGTILGVVEAVVAIYFILGVAFIYIDKIDTYAPAVAKEFNQSHIGHFVSKNNFVKSFELFSSSAKNKVFDSSELPHSTDNVQPAAESDVVVEPEHSDSSKNDTEQMQPRVLNRQPR